MIDLLVVGAGPAGLAAARKAGELGLRVVVVDENARAGGQYYRQPSLASARLDHRQRRGLVEIGRVTAVADLRLGCTVVGIDRADDGLRVWMEQGGIFEPAAPRAVVLATGAFDTPIAFPGWTLPGVISAGAAQALVKSQRVRPGHRAVIAGSGPFLFAVGETLLRAGVRVVEIAEATSVRRSLRHLPATLRHPGRYLELARYVLPLVTSGVAVRRGTVIAAAEGDGRVQTVRLRQRLSARGSAAHDEERLVEADLLCIGYGFSVSTELARLAGAALTHDVGLGQAVPVFDAWQETTRPGLFVAGEACGLGGADAAAGEGELAAIGAARYLNRLSEADAHSAAKPIRHRLDGLRAFASLLPRLFPVPGELQWLARDETTVCRCENVSLGTVLQALDKSAVRTLNEIKTVTRCGQGWCQGRICGALLPDLVSARTDRFDPSVPFTARVPVRPLSLAAVAALERRTARARR